ncbi:SET domain [seawater metagenome]|uniref:SET domain n=1 Tax=seawater metagenome TaxID=1561972 RepID=A0A5E8CHE5_9ZZZZ
MTLLLSYNRLRSGKVEAECESIFGIFRTIKNKGNKTLIKLFNKEKPTEIVLIDKKINTDEMKKLKIKYVDGEDEYELYYYMENELDYVYCKNSLNINCKREKNLGVYAKKNIRKGTIFMMCPILVDDWKGYDDSLEINNYLFDYPQDPDKCVITFGLGSMINHSKKDANSAWVINNDRLLYFYATTNIFKGDEIFHDYGYKLD